MIMKNTVKKIVSKGTALVMAAAFTMSTTSAFAVDLSMDVTIDGVEYSSTIVSQVSIPREIIRRANSDMKKGETVTLQEGTDGVKEVSYKVYYEDGVEVNRAEVYSSVLVEPVDMVIEYGTAQANTAVTNSGELSYKYVVDCLATAYDPSPEENGGYGGQSATGVPLQKGVIAVDPKVIPLGSRVYVEAIDGSWSYGYAVAADTGGAIKGNRVDLLYQTKSECYQFGRRNCRVYVLD